LKRTDVSQLAGLPAIPRDARLQIVVTDASLAPVAGARVTVADQTGELLAAPARGDGSLFFFPGIAGAAPGDDLQITATLGGDTATAVAKVGDDKVSLRLAATHAGPPAALDLALVVDNDREHGGRAAVPEGGDQQHLGAGCRRLSGGLPAMGAHRLP
jgi:hypothetical protein